MGAILTWFAGLRSAPPERPASPNRPASTRVRRRRSLSGGGAGQYRHGGLRRASASRWSSPPWVLSNRPKARRLRLQRICRHGQSGPGRSRPGAGPLAAIPQRGLLRAGARRRGVPPRHHDVLHAFSGKPARAVQAGRDRGLGLLPGARPRDDRRQAVAPRRADPFCSRAVSRSPSSPNPRWRSAIPRSPRRSPSFSVRATTPCAAS